jgi:O-antigen/teichoic acid export membrane protein
MGSWVILNIKSMFLKSILILTSGSLIAQLIVVGASPFITRFYTPADIGLYTYILAISHMFMGIINGRYDMSIVFEEKDERVLSLVKLSFIICLVASIIITIGFGLYFNYFSTQPTYIAVFLFLLLLSYGIINTLTAYNNRHREYKIMSTVYILRTSCQHIGAILLGLFKTGLLSLLIPYTIGQFLGINAQAKSIKPQLNKLKRVTGKEMLEVLKLHYKQPLFSVPALFANAFSYSSVTFFIGELFTMSVVGFYSISVRVLGLPLSVVSGNVSRVFFEEASREFKTTGGFRKAFNKSTIFLVSLAIPMVIFMMIFAPPLCGFVFGEGWEVAGEYIKILAPMFGIRFVVTALSPGLLIANKQNYELVLQLMLVAASVISFILTKVNTSSIEEFLLYICVSKSIVFIAYFVSIAIFSGKRKELSLNE